MNPDNYKDSVAAARAALTESNIPDAFVASYDRMWFGDDKNNTDNLTQNQISNRDNLKDQDDFRISHIESNASQKTYIRTHRQSVESFFITGSCVGNCKV